jgi:hypothetical protein
MGACCLPSLLTIVIVVLADQLWRESLMLAYQPLAIGEGAEKVILYLTLHMRSLVRCHFSFLNRLWRKEDFPWRVTI